MDQDSVSEGELEDGEVLSSDEEEEGDSKVCKLIKPPFWFCGSGCTYRVRSKY
jgi:hypothetical protein